MRAILISFITILFFVQCKEAKSPKLDNSENHSEIVPRGDTAIPEGYVKLEVERSLPTERALAETKLEDYFSSNPEPMQSVAGRKFQIDFRMVVNQESPNEPIEGEWIEFNQDFSCQNRSIAQLLEYW